MSASPSSAGVSRTTHGAQAERLQHQAHLGQLGRACVEPPRAASPSSTTSGSSSTWRFTPSALELRLQPLIDQPLVRGMLVDDHHALGGLRHDIGLVQLRARRAQRIVEAIGRGFGRRRMRASADGPPTSNAACAASAKPGASAQPGTRRARGRVAGKRRVRRAGQSQRAGRGGSGRNAREVAHRRSRRAMAGRAPSACAARRRSGRAPGRHRGSAPRSWPDGR